MSLTVILILAGVQSVDIDIEKGEIKAKGKLDPVKILKIIEKKSKKKVELISPKVMPKEITATDKKPKKTKEVSIFLYEFEHSQCFLNEIFLIEKKIGCTVELKSFNFEVQELNYSSSELNLSNPIILSIFFHLNKTISLMCYHINALPFYCR